MNVNSATKGILPGSYGDLVRRVRTNEALTRASLAKTTGLAPSTVSLRVDALLEAGILQELGPDVSRGGRRARLLAVSSEIGTVAAVDLGSSHANVAVANTNGIILASGAHQFEARNGPEDTVQWVWEQICALLSEAKMSEDSLLGIVVGVPAPVEHPSGTIVSPSFMPSWHGVELPNLFKAHTSSPIVVENDAHLMALGEHFQAQNDRNQHLLVIKLGTRIGCGIISDGSLYQGSGGAAGEIGHTAVPGDSLVSCTCGVPGCLESVAGGGALVEELRLAGYSIDTPTDVVKLSEDRNNEAVLALQKAGSNIGRVLATLINFHNPQDVILGGSLSTSSLLVASIRSEIFQRCLPLVASNLRVRASSMPTGAGIVGAVSLALDEALSPDRIEALISNS